MLVIQRLQTSSGPAVHLCGINQHLAAVHVLAVVVIDNIEGALRVCAVVSGAAVVHLQATHTAILLERVLAGNLGLHRAPQERRWS